jgi:hypothetical protein
MLKELCYNSHKGSELKRFIMFASYYYYPSGGLNDARITADTLAELLHWHVEQGGKFDYDEWHIFDCQTMTTIKDSKC